MPTVVSIVGEPLLGKVLHKVRLGSEGQTACGVHGAQTVWVGRQDGSYTAERYCRRCWPVQ